MAEEASGGIVLLVAAVVALLWANSPWGSSYRWVWHTDVLGHEDLRHWVNDALMAVFFLVVGLEIKRELVHGKLRDPRVAATPAIAAAGGMAVPALLYLLVNAGGAGAGGWGLPLGARTALPARGVPGVRPPVPAFLELFPLPPALAAAHRP